jgi:hypothetical protein
MNKIVVGLFVLSLLLVGCINLIHQDKIVVDNSIDSYQGPVPQGYSSEHFRKTGETIKEVNA